MSAVSVVIAARNEPTLADTVAATCARLPGDGEVVVVDDASYEEVPAAVEAADARVRVHRAPHRLGVAVARNLGAALARGDVLVFADGHVRPGDGWVSMLEPLADPGVGAVGPTLVDDGSGGIGRGLRVTDVQLNTDWMPSADADREPYAVPLLPGFFLGMRRQTFVDIGGFDPGLVGWGIDDIEVCLHLLMLGYRCVVVPAVDVLHAPVPDVVPDYHLEWHHGLHNILRTGHVHFGEARREAMYESFSEDENLATARATLDAGDAESRRAAVQAARRFDDDWLFELCAVQ